MILVDATTGGAGESIPRESGDDPHYVKCGVNGAEYSPRERG